MRWATAPKYSEGWYDMGTLHVFPVKTPCGLFFALALANIQVGGPVGGGAFDSAKNHKRQRRKR